MTDLAERARQLRERASQDYAERWDFREIPDLTGIVEAIDVVTIEGVDRIVVTIKEVEGPEDARKRRSVWLSQAALFNRFRDLAIVEGELVSIKYLGEGEPAKPGFSPPHKFRVEVDRAGTGRGFNWAPHLGNGGQSSPPPAPPPPPAQAAEQHDSAMERYAPPPGDDDIPF